MILGARPTPYYGPWRDVTLVGGTRVVAVRDGRIPLVELRFRLPLGEPGWRRPQDVDALVQVLAGHTGTTGRTEERGGTFHLTTDGRPFPTGGGPHILSNMENSFSTPGTSGTPDPAHASAALNAAAESRARVADRITSPWWYHGGLGAAFALMFASMSLRMANWAVGPFVLVVLGLGWALQRSTGVSMDRYMSTPGASRLSMAYAVALLGLAATGMCLEWGADVRWAIAGAGVLIGALTTVMGYRIDAAARRDLRAGR